MMKEEERSVEVIEDEEMGGRAVETETAAPRVVGGVDVKEESVVDAADVDVDVVFEGAIVFVVVGFGVVIDD